MASINVKELYPKPNWQLEINGVTCSIYLSEDGQSAAINESFPPEGRHVTVTFHCYWEDRNDLVQGLLGTVDYDGTTVIRTAPFSIPLADRDNNEDDETKMYLNRCFCTSITNIEGTKWITDIDGSVTGELGWGYYVFAKVTAEFTSPPYLIDPIPTLQFNDPLNILYAITKTRISGEVFAPPTGSFIYADGPFQNQPLLDIGASQIRSRVEISCTRMRLPFVPMKTFGPLIGAVNEDPITIATQDFTKGSVLFTGINPEPRSDQYDGGIVQDVEITLLANTQASTKNANDPLDWNYFLAPDGNWTKVTTIAGDPVFAYKDLTRLFKNDIA